MEKTYTAEEVAELKRCSVDKVQADARDGVIKGKKNGAWVFFESAVQEYLTGVKPEAVEGESKDVKAAENALAIAKANTMAAAIRHGYTGADPVAEWHEDVNKWRQKKEEEEAKIAADKAQNAADKENGTRLYSDANDKLAEAEELREKYQKLYPDAEQEINEAIKRVLQHFKGGTVGMAEKVLFMLTSPLVRRAWVEYKCPDCHKDGKDGVKRVSFFDIPKLKDCPPFYAFAPCADCDQYESRKFPEYLCSICPVEDRMKAAAALLDDVITAMGIKTEYDDDGQYKPAYEYGKAQVQNDAVVIRQMKKRLEDRLEEEGIKPPWKDIPPEAQETGEKIENPEQEVYYAKE